MNEAVGRVQLERQMRGSWSIRKAAATSGVMSNQTWSVYEGNGVVTAKVRAGVSKAFDWPMDWPENLPPVVNSPDVEDRLQAQIDDLYRLVRDLGKQVKAMRDPRKRRSDTP